MTDTPPASITGYVLNGTRRSVALSDAALGAALEGAELAWAHLPLDVEQAELTDRWLADNVPGLDSTTRRALTGEFTRPRALAAGAGLMVVLRGVNLNPGEDPADMISVRVYLDKQRVVTLSRRPLRSVAALSARVAAGTGPETPGAFLHDLSDELITRIEDVMEQLEADTDHLEDQVDDRTLDRHGASATRVEARRLRRMILGMRRHVAPQRDAVTAAATLMPDVIGKADRRKLQEIHDRHQRALEELDELAGRLTLVREEIRAEQDERTNRNLYLLSILSALFLPLGFLTGLLGINVGGIPGADAPRGFLIFCGILGVIFLGLIGVLLRLRRL